MKTKIFVFICSDSFSDFIEFVRNNQSDATLSMLASDNKDCLVISLSRIDI